MYAAYIKRPLDFIISLIALIVLSPLLLAVAIYVKIRIGSPVIFKQKRPGKDGQLFTLYKFWTGTDKPPRKKGVTKYGNTLRSTGLDKLPGWWNVLKGDMSVIGPRPLTVQYLPLYNPIQKRRYEVRPGLTGYARVHMRDLNTWKREFELDVEYVDHISFISDMKILLRTPVIAVRRETVNYTADITTEEIGEFQKVELLKNRQSCFPSRGFMKKVIIIGNGGHGKVIADIVRLNGDDIFGFLDDKNPKIPGLRILGNTDSIKLFDIEEFFFIVAIGSNPVRKRIMESAAVRWYTAIHPSAVIAGDAGIGPGSCVAANAVINSNTKIGTGAIINTAATVDHDNIIGDFTHVCPGTHLGGTVRVGEGCFIGIGSRVINNLDICSGVTIGAGGVVIKSITEPGTYVGVPVRKLEK